VRQSELTEQRVSVRRSGNLAPHAEAAWLVLNRFPTFTRLLIWHHDEIYPASREAARNTFHRHES
jgi:hypothetical protein